MKTNQQEPDRIASRPVLTVVLATIVATAIGVLVAWWLEIGQLAQIRGDLPPTRPAQVPTEVNAMETAPFARRAQGLETNQAAEAWLGSWGWLDRERGLVHMPIDTAIDLYLSGQEARP